VSRVKRFPHRRERCLDARWLAVKLLEGERHRPWGHRGIADLMSQPDRGIQELPGPRSRRPESPTACSGSPIASPPNRYAGAATFAHDVGHVDQGGPHRLGGALIFFAVIYTMFLVTITWAALHHFFDMPSVRLREGTRALLTALGAPKS
jgi:Fe2+ transport system protein B